MKSLHVRSFSSSESALQLDLSEGAVVVAAVCLQGYSFTSSWNTSGRGIFQCFWYPFIIPLCFWCMQRTTTHCWCISVCFRWQNPGGDPNAQTVRTQVCHTVPVCAKSSSLEAKQLLTEEQSLAWKAWHACLTHVYVNPIHHLCACARWGNTQLRGCLFLPCRTCVQCLFLTACPHLTSSYTAFHFSACSVCDCLFSLLLMKVWTPNAFLSGWSSASSVWHNVINSAAMALFIGLVNLPEPMSRELGFWLQGSQWDSSLLWLHFGFVRNRPNLPLWQELGFSDTAMLCIADLWPWWHSAGRYLQVDFLGMWASGVYKSNFVYGQKAFRSVVKCAAPTGLQSPCWGECQTTPSLSPQLLKKHLVEWRIEMLGAFHCLF